NNGRPPMKFDICVILAISLFSVSAVQLVNKLFIQETTSAVEVVTPIIWLALAAHYLFRKF
ncbi:MAG: hypothetical protein AAFR16_00225, partial [Pseudomonadota bacterium]